MIEMEKDSRWRDNIFFERNRNNTAMHEIVGSCRANAMYNVTTLSGWDRSIVETKVFAKFMNKVKKMIVEALEAINNPFCNTSDFGQTICNSILQDYMYDEFNRSYFDRAYTDPEQYQHCISNLISYQKYAVAPTHHPVQIGSMDDNIWNLLTQGSQEFTFFPADAGPARKAVITQKELTDCGLTAALTAHIERRMMQRCSEEFTFQLTASNLMSAMMPEDEELPFIYLDTCRNVKDSLMLLAGMDLAERIFNDGKCGKMAVKYEAEASEMRLAQMAETEAYEEKQKLLQTKLNQLSAKLDSIDAANQDKMASLQKELVRKEHEIANLKRQLALLKKEPESVTDEVNDVIEEKGEIDYTGYDHNKRFIIVATEKNGFQEQILKLFPNAEFLTTFDNPPSGADLVVLVTMKQSHSLYAKVKNHCKMKEIPYMHVTATNAAIIEKEIGKYYMKLGA